MKEKYIFPEIVVTTFDEVDVIATSSSWSDTPIETPTIPINPKQIW